MSILNKSKKESVDGEKKQDQPQMKIEQKVKTVQVKHKIWEEIKQLDANNQRLKNGLMVKFLQRESLTNKIRTEHRDVSIIEDKLKGIVDKLGVKKGEQFRLTPKEDEIQVIYFDVVKDEEKKEQK